MEEPIVESSRKVITSLFVIFSCFFLDRISKIYILNFFTKNDFTDQYVNSYLNLILIWNKGVAFGLLQSEDFFYNLVSIIIIMVIAFLCFLIYKTDKKTEIMCYSLVVGGALGNFTDRIYYQAVPDFIDFQYKYLHWFTFNFADIFITVGILLLLISDMLKFKNN